MGYPREGEPLAPSILRELLDRPAPSWARDRGFACLADLDARVWSAFEAEACRRLANMVVERVRSRLPSASRALLRRTLGTLPPQIRSSDLALDVHTANTLARARLAARLPALANMSVHELASVPGMGARCLVDLLCAWEHVQRRSERFPPPIPTPRPATPGRHPSRRSPMRRPESDEPFEIEEEHVEQALRRLLELAGPRAERARAGLAARLGWTGGTPRTLEAAGAIAGVTRERIRQIQERFQGNVRDHYRSPALERAVALLEEAAPIPAQEAMDLLVDEGVASHPVHPSVISSAADLLGLQPRFRVMELQPIGTVVAPIDAEVEPDRLRKVLNEIRRCARPFGFIHREVVARILREMLNEPSAEVGDLFLRFCQAADLGQDWFYIVTDRREPAIRLIDNMLAVAGGRLTANDLEEGFRRRMRWRKAGGHLHGDGWPPSSEAILGLCRSKPDRYEVHGDIIRGLHPVDRRLRIPATERALVDALLRAPGRVMHRDDFERTVTSQGVNPNTFSVLTSYSPFVKELGHGLWTVRGVEPDPLDVERLKRSRRNRRRQVEGWEWTASGALRILVRLRRIHSLVVGLPSAVRPYLAGRAFTSSLEDGSRAGSVRVDEEGTSWGYGPALSRLAPTPGDLLVIDFHLSSETTTLHLVREGNAQREGVADA